MSNPSVFEDSSLRSELAVRTLVGEQQTAFAKARGSSALALMVADAYVAIRRILNSASAAVQAAILDEHGVSAAEAGTSKFTPWIKVYWGEYDLDDTKTFKDGEGETRRVWVPDRSMEIYHHTMEELMARGVETTDIQAIAETIMASKGAATMAKERKARLAQRAKDKAAPVTENTRKLFLENTIGPMVDLPFARPEKMGKFVTLIARVIEDSQGVEVLGIVDADAIKTLDKLADAQAPGIKARLAEQARGEHLKVLEAQASAAGSMGGGERPEGAPESTREAVARVAAQFRERQQGA